MEPLIHILQLEDDAADAGLIQALLEEADLACRTTRVQTAEEFESAVRQGGYDIILADYRLPMYNGMSALRLVQELGLDVPFIFVSGTMGEDAAIKGLREGATDYVLKQKLSRLVPAIKRALGEAENRRKRQQAEKSLAAQFQFLQHLIDTIPSPIFYKDTNGVYLGCNQNLAEFLGRPKEEIIGKMVFDVYPKEQAETYYQMDQELFQSPGTQIYESLMKGSEGTIRNFIFSKATFVDFSGKVAGLIGVMTDITARKQTEEKLIRAKEEWELTFDSIPDLITILDTEHRVVRVNRSMAAKLGIKPGEAVGYKCYEMVHKTAAPPVFCPHAKLLADGMEHTVEIVEENLGGDFLVTASPLRDSRGNLSGSVHIARDITEQKLTQDAVRRSEARFRTAFENASVGMAMVDANGVYLETNSAMAKMIGYVPSEIVGKKVVDFTHPDDLGLRSQFIQDLLDGKIISGEQERRFIHRDGSVIHALIWASIQRDEKGEFEYFISLIQDVTKRVLDQQEKEKLEAQLQQAQKMESLGTLAGGIAHDFNNILAVIIGSSELLNMMNAVEESSRDSLKNIIAASQRAKELVRQILAFSRHANQEKILLNLKPIVRETTEFLRASLPTTIQLSLNLDPKAGTIMADPTQIQQILMNLCTNAAHAMEMTGGVLQVHLSNVTLNLDDVRFDSEMSAGEYVQLTVTDTGHGIDPRIMNRIFDPYFTTKEKGKGTGLGLAVVHGIVKAHGGTIKAYSEAGKGASFQVLLPRVEGYEKTGANAAPVLLGGIERILLVDDEKALADIEKQMLNWLGYNVEVRTSAVEALEAFRANPKRFDLVITDLTMPQMTGMKLAKQMIQIRPDIPVILCTGFSDQIDEKQALSSGIKSFLLKPLVARELAEAVRKVLTHKPG